jgi:hypothetical protein
MRMQGYNDNDNKVALQTERTTSVNTIEPYVKSNIQRYYSR